jgi:hypothetical protein
MNKQTITQFDPVSFSTEENRWLLEHLGEPKAVALRNLTPGINPNAIRPLVERIQELEELGEAWVGVDALKGAIKTYLEQDAKWAADHARNKRAPRFPSLFSFDSKGRPHLGGPGSDSGQVRTYFDAKGNRLPFAIDLIKDDLPEWVAPGFGVAESNGTEKLEKGLTVDSDKNRIECFCGHTEQYKADSRASYNAARARISKHLRKATVDVEQHRETHTNEFGG